MKINRIESPNKSVLQKKRVCAYARVSSGKEAMIHSLFAQTTYYENLISKSPMWQFCGVFADEAFTGTKEDRPEFSKLLEKCRNGEIDMIITKSISRLARNTVTVLKTVRELKSLGVDIFFEEQNIHSLSSEGELMLTILSSYAQEESLSVSENCKWRIRNDFKKGKPNTGKMLGYRLIDGKLCVVPEEALIVKEIFNLYLSGFGITAIMKRLKESDMSFSKNGISLILKNEKYIGDLRLQKTFVNDHITKQKKRNQGELPQYYVTASHEPIIDKDTFEKVQAEIKARAEKYNPTKTKATNYPFTSLIKCQYCGATYRRKTTAFNIVWICQTYNDLGKDKCDSKQIPEDILIEKIAEICLVSDIDEILVTAKDKFLIKLKNGEQSEVLWQNKSRSNSWTPEMREKARQKALERSKKNGN